jgi:hypothetical protein
MNFLFSSSYPVFTGSEKMTRPIESVSDGFIGDQGQPGILFLFCTLTDLPEPFRGPFHVRVERGIPVKRTIKISDGSDGLIFS